MGADGRGRILDLGSDEGARRAVDCSAIATQYRESPPSGPVLAIDVERWSGWSGS